jgi:hypothetical protein
MLSACVCILAGPIVFASVGWWFWLETGELQIVDRLMLWELGAATFLSWLLAFAAVNIKDQLLAAWPGAAVAVAAQFGWRLLPISLSAAAIFWVHASWLLFTLEVRINEPAAELFLLFLCCLSFLFWMTFLCRWIGIAWFHLQSSAAATR